MSLMLEVNKRRVFLVFLNRMSRWESFEVGESVRTWDSFYSVSL